MKKVDAITKGDTLEQNIFRHDSLLALPKGTRIKSKEIEYLKDLQLQSIYISDFDKHRNYGKDETLDIIKDLIYSCTLWDIRFSKKLYSYIGNSLKKNKKVLQVLSMLRKADHYSFVASVNISLVVCKMMMTKNKFDRYLGDMTFFAMIHDIGKIRVSKYTTKEGELTETEFQMVRKHPIFSHKLLEKFGFSKNDIAFSMQTHERYDGTGYPMFLYKEQIEPLAQVISIAEMYNALSSFRPYRPAFHPIEVSNKIEQEENRAFSEEYVNLFINNFTPYRKNIKVELSNGMEGRIVEINNNAPMFPKIELFNPDTGLPFQTVNLYNNKDLRIARVLI